MYGSDLLIDISIFSKKSVNFSICRIFIFIIMIYFTISCLLVAKIDTRIIILYTICIIIGSWSIVMYRSMDRSVDRGVVDRGVVYYRGMVNRFVMDNRGVVNRSMVNGGGVVDRGMVNGGVMDRGVVANGSNRTTGMVTVDRGMVTMDRGVVAMDWGMVADRTKPTMAKGNNAVMAWAMISQGQASQCDENKYLE